MTTMPQPKAPASGYTAKYDAWNRLISLDGGSGVVQQNTYDGFHRRIVHDETGGSGDRRHFYYNENWQCLEERLEVSGTIDPDPIKRYVWHLYYIDALAAVWYDSDVDGNLSELTDGYYNFLHDANFNVVGVLSGGAVIERYNYTPYGVATVLNADFSLDSSSGGDGKSDIGNEFLYTGRRLDPETGLQLNRNRYYHQQLGRWLTRDPIGYEGSPYNLYEYVGGSPTNGIDPSGLGWLDWLFGKPCPPKQKVVVAPKPPQKLTPKVKAQKAVNNAVRQFATKELQCRALQAAYTKALQAGDRITAVEIHTAAMAMGCKW